MTTTVRDPDFPRKGLVCQQNAEGAKTLTIDPGKPPALVSDCSSCTNDRQNPEAAAPSLGAGKFGSPIAAQVQASLFVSGLVDQGPYFLVVFIEFDDAVQDLPGS